jgi:WD40 repeat protein
VLRRLLPPLLLGLLGSLAVSQQPKPPAFPPINPAVARLGQTAKGLPGPALGVAFEDGKGILAVGCEDGALLLWAKEEGKELLSGGAKGQTIKAHAKAVTGLAAGGGVLATGSTDGKVLVWSLPGDKPKHAIAAGSAVRCVAVSADGKMIASGGDDNTVQLWDPADGKQLKKLTGPADRVTAAAFSGDGKFLAAGGHDGKLWVWETASGRKLFDVPAHQPLPPKAPPPDTNVVNALAFSPDGKQIALGTSDGKVYVFGAADGKYVRTLQGHTGAITGLAWRPDNAALVSSSKDRTLRLWNPQNGAALKTLEGHTAWAEGVVFLDRGARLASAGADRTARIWELTPPQAKTKK